MFNHMMQKMLDNLTEERDKLFEQSEYDSDDPDGDNGERLLVFKDLKGHIWQINKVTDPVMDFTELTDDTARELHAFKPSLQ